MSVHHFVHFLERFQEAVWEGCDGIPYRWVGPSAWWEAFVHLDALCNVRSSEFWDVHGAEEWQLLLFLGNGDGQGLNELLLILWMIGRGSRGTSGASGGSSMTSGSSTAGSGSANRIRGSSSSTVFSWHLDTVCSGLEIERWMRWWIGSNWWSKVNC